VDYGIRSSNGQLMIFESGSWRRTGSTLHQGDELAIHVSGTQLNYLHNGAVVFTSTITGTEAFYVDMAFKSGAVSLGSFRLSQ